MKKLYILISLILTLVVPLSAYAAKPTVKKDPAVEIGPSGDAMTDKPITIEEQEQALLNDSTISDEKKTKIKERFDAHRKLIEQSKTRNAVAAGEISAQLANDPSGSHFVPYFKQEKNYWCGPATTKQTIHFINSKSSTQTTIATAIGTTTAGSNLTDMVNYLNKNQTKHVYLIITTPDENLIQSIPEYAVDNGSPAIGRLKITKGGNWPYSSSGHFLNMSGYSNYGQSIRVTDPYIGWVQTNSTGSYWVTSKEFLTATLNHFAQQVCY